MGGGIGMGNTCKPLAVSFQCMTKSTTNKKKKKCEKKKNRLNQLKLKDNVFHFQRKVWRRQSRTGRSAEALRDLGYI